MLSDSNPLINKVRGYLGYLMAALYLVIGLLFLFSDIAIQTFPVYREAVGVVLIAYAGFRVYAIMKKNKS